MSTFCTVERDRRLLIVTMNRPEKLNAFGSDAHWEMADIFKAFEADPALDVAILTGAGRAFCAGSDIQCYVEGTNRPLPPEGGAGLTHNHRLTKPVIAAVNGLAMGGGCEVALACDIIIASEDASFALPEPKVGAAALGGGIIQIFRKLPASIAMNMVLTGDRLSAADAFRFGLISQLTARDDLLDTARALAARIIAASPAAVRATLKMGRLALSGETATVLERVEANLRQAVMAGADFAEGMAAFVEKRQPRWAGQ